MKVSSSLNYNTQWDQQMCCARIYVLSMSVLSVNLYTSRQSGHDQYISSCATHFSIPMWVHQFSNCLTLVFSPHAAAMWGGGQPRLFVLTEALDGYLGWHRPTLTTKALIFSKKEVSKVLPLPPATSRYLRRHKGENSIISHRVLAVPGHLLQHCSTGPSISINTAALQPRSEITD